MHSRQDLYMIIKAFTGQNNNLVIPTELIRFVGDVNSALLLSQIIYWSDKTESGWMYKTYVEWEEEIALSEYQVRRAAKRLESLGLIETKLKKANGSPTVHYRIKSDSFSDSILKFLQNRNLRNSRNVSVETQERFITETTTETTTNNTYVLSVKKTSSRKSDYTIEFETFWSHYPRTSVGKKEAFKCWTTCLKQKKATADELIASAQNYAAYCELMQTEERYIKHAKTFLGPQEHFRDFIAGVPSEAYRSRKRTNNDQALEEYARRAGLMPDEPGRDFVNIQATIHGLSTSADDS